MTRTSRIPPAEWAPQQAMFTAFPSAADLWLDDLVPAQAEVAAMVRQLATSVAMHVLAHGSAAASAARAAVGDVATVHEIPFGDIWLRDTGPIFTSAQTAVRFAFNGWGGKYDLPHDDSVGGEMAALIDADTTVVDAVIEGGALEFDGQGLVLTTEQCLLNPNRNPGWTRAIAERVLHHAVGARRTVWLGDGLLHDHTDGHVDNLARFVASGIVAVPLATTADDPNRAVFDDARARLRAAGLAVADIPSVGLYAPEGEIVPASYMNWVVANGQLVVPLYGAANDDAALTAIRRCFPRHKVTGLPASHILTGGGSFHCITQQVPAA